MKKVSKVLVIIVIALITAVIMWGIFGHRRKLNYVISSQNQMVNAIADAVVDHKTVLIFDSTVSPDGISFEEMFTKVYEKDRLSSYEFYRYSYRYTMKGGYYHVKMELSKPYLWKERLAQWRAKSIAKALNKKLSSDYDKVKAVHDYLITINKYSYFYGGAFNCMFYRSSACNGYAYSFHAIMTELGIPVRFEFTPDHVWNNVMIDGKWYNIDVTWDDQNGTVIYDYFLKCNDDWDHSGGGSDAKTSLELKGRSARENVRLIPSYRTYLNIGGIIFVICLFPLFKLLKKLMDDSELKRINKEMEEEERKRRQFEQDLDRKRQEFSNRDDDFFAL